MYRNLENYTKKKTQRNFEGSRRVMKRRAEVMRHKRCRRCKLLIHDEGRFHVCLQMGVYSE